MCLMDSSRRAQLNLVLAHLRLHRRQDVLEPQVGVAVGHFVDGAHLRHRGIEEPARQDLLLGQQQLRAFYVLLMLVFEPADLAQVARHRQSAGFDVGQPVFLLEFTVHALHHQFYFERLFGRRLHRQVGAAEEIFHALLQSDGGQAGGHVLARLERQGIHAPQADVVVEHVGLLREHAARGLEALQALLEHLLVVAHLLHHVFDDFHVLAVGSGEFVHVLVRL